MYFSVKIHTENQFSPKIGVQLLLLSRHPCYFDMGSRAALGNPQERVLNGRLSMEGFKTINFKMPSWDF